MVTLNKPVQGDSNWYQPVTDNWTTIEGSLNKTVTLVKTGDTSRSNTATLADDPDLQFSIGANETWAFEIMVFHTIGTATPDIQVALNGPINGPSVLRAHAESYPGGGTAPSNGVLITAYATPFAIDYGSSPINSLVTIRGAVKNGPTAGTFSLQWAQRVSNATATTVQAGSYMVAHQV